jgi:translation initiation factor 2 subunit 1
MIKIKKVEEVGAYVVLLEYNNIEGMILSSEYTRKRTRSVSRLIKVNKEEAVMVLRVDTEKGYIDLSRRKVKVDDQNLCEKMYKQSKKVHNVMKQTAAMLNKDLEELYIQFGWPLYEKHEHAYNAFKAAVGGNAAIFEEYNLDEKTKEVLMNNIEKRMKPKPVKVRADFELTCFGYEGIDAIKSVL